MTQTLLNANCAEFAITGRDPAASLLGRLLRDRGRPAGTDSRPSG